jgi:hypothetical protein
VNDPKPRVRVSTIVPTDPADAFEVFTQETGLWWRRDPRFRMSSSVPGTVRFEAGSGGGRVLEEFPDGESTEIGTIVVWEPGKRLIFEWQSPHFDPSVRTEVEVTFARVTDGTEVTLEHRGWNPDRFSPAFGDLVGLWWGDLFTSYRLQLRNR